MHPLDDTAVWSYEINRCFAGGRYELLGSDECTHLVVDDHNVKDLPSDISLPQYVVRAEVSIIHLRLYHIFTHLSNIIYQKK